MKDSELDDVASPPSPRKSTLLPETRHETCLFLHPESDDGRFGSTTSIPKKSTTGEDIRVIIPEFYTFVIDHNVITITDTNDQPIRIVFQTPIEASLYLEKTNPPSDVADLTPSPIGEVCNRTQAHEGSGENFNGGENDLLKNKCATEAFLKYQVIKNDGYEEKPSKPNTEREQFNFFNLEQANSIETSHDPKQTSSSTNTASLLTNRIRKDNSGRHCRTRENLSKEINMLNNRSPGDIYLTSETSSDSREENTAKLYKTEREQCNFLNVEQPLLLKYKDGIEQSHVLLYTFHSVQSMFAKSASAKYSDIVENLLRSSIPYVGESVYWMFNPQRQIQKLKWIEKNSSIPGHSSVAENDILKIFTNNCAPFDKTDERKRFPVCNLTIKLPDRKRMSRTAMKRVNIRQLATSIFAKNFHFYANLGGNLKSGAVITRSNSTYWLMVSGVVKDSTTLRLAAELFAVIAGKKIVLNIYDYLLFLITFARTRKIVVPELVKRMATCRHSNFIVMTQGNIGDAGLCTSD